MWDVVAPVAHQTRFLPVGSLSIRSSKRRIATHAFPVDLALYFLYNPFRTTLREGLHG